jgi:hypothetical protein
MSQPADTTHQDSVYQQPHLGLSEGAAPVLPQCTINGCTFIGISSQSAEDHISIDEHLNCHMPSCEGRYSISQEVVHMWNYHQIRPATVQGKPMKCQFQGCSWSTDNATAQVEHEQEFHTNCDVIDCDFRGTLGDYHIHGSKDHNGNEAKKPEME